MIKIKKTIALATTIFLTLLATPANAAEPPTPKDVVAPIVSKSVSVNSDADVSFTREAVSSQRIIPQEPAPVITVQQAPTPAVAPPAPVPVQQTAPAPVQQPVAVAPLSTPAPAPAAPSGRGGALLASAYSQLGVQQDCTAMVEKALASIGIHTGDIAPAGFLAYGTPVAGPAQAGDILVYGGHVAIAVDSTTAVHGGWNGGTTAVGPIEVGQGAPTIVRL